MGVLRPVAALAAAAVLLGGCSPDDQELRQQRLEEVVATTFAGPVAFNLAIDASDEALSAFGDAAGPLGALLAGSSAAGVIEGDRVAVGLAIGGVDVVQVRVTAPGEQYVRFNLGALVDDGAGAVGSQLEEALAGAELEPDAREAVLAAARGAWVRLASTDSTDSSDATDATDTTDTADRPSAGTSLGAALEALLLSAVPVGHSGSLDAVPFDGRLDVEVDVARALAAAAQALAGVVPSPLPTVAPADTGHLDGRVLVADGVVRTVVLELGPMAEGAEGVAPEGADGVALELGLRRLDASGLVQAPDVVATVTPEQLQRAAAALGDLAPGPEP